MQIGDFRHHKGLGHQLDAAPRGDEVAFQILQANVRRPCRPFEQYLAGGGMFVEPLLPGAILERLKFLPALYVLRRLVQHTRLEPLQISLCQSAEHQLRLGEEMIDGWWRNADLCGDCVNADRRGRQRLKQLFRSIKDRFEPRMAALLRRAADFGSCDITYAHGRSLCLYSFGYRLKKQSFIGFKSENIKLS